MSPDASHACGLGYKAPRIPHIAQDLLDKLGSLSSEEAVALLQTVKGIGRWTAGVAICDVRGDWSIYPFEDLAVRTWAARLWPGFHWPQDERAKMLAWQAIHGAYIGHITCYLLAHAGRSSQSELSEPPA